jgi:hypothetical protein
MPRVPSQFVPQVAPQDGGTPPVQATEVVPMRSFAGEQQAQMGQAMTQLGNVTWRIGQIIQDEVNEAKIKESEVQLGNYANEILRGRDGYFNTEGKLAEDRFPEFESALNESANKILDSLDNDMQKSMFRTLAARNLSNWKGAMADHRNRKVRDYNINSTIARADMYVDNAATELAERGRTGSFDVTSSMAIKSIQDAMMLRGVPLGSPMMKEAEQNVWAGIANLAVRKMSESRMYERALDYLTQEQRNGHLSERKANDLRAPLIERRRAQMAPEIAFSIKNSGTIESESGTGNYVMPVTGGDIQITTDANKRYKYSVLPDTPVNSPTDGTVTGVSDDGTEITVQSSDGTSMRFTGMGKVMVRKGQEVAQNAIIGLPARDGDRASFQYEMHRGNVVIDPAKPNTLPVVINREGGRTGAPTSLAEALAIANQIPDQELRKAVIAETRNLYAYDGEQFNARRMDAISNAKLWAAEFLLRQRNNPEGQQQVITRSMLIEQMSGRGREFMTDEDIQSIVDMTGTPAYVLNEWESRRMTIDEINRKYADIVAPEDLRKMRKESENPKFQEFRIVQDELDEILGELNMTSYVNPEKGSTEEAAALAIRRNVNEMVRRAQVDRGQPLEASEREKIIKDALGIHVWKKGTVWWYPQRAMEETYLDEDAFQPKREGETDDEYRLRLDKWRTDAEEVIRTPDNMRVPAWQVREAMFEIAAAGERINYEESVVPVARMMNMMDNRSVSSDEMRRIMRVTAGNMTPNQRTRAIEDLFNREEPITAESVMRERKIDSIVERVLKSIGQPATSENLSAYKTGVMSAFSEIESQGRAATFESVYEVIKSRSSSAAVSK